MRYLRQEGEHAKGAARAVVRRRSKALRCAALWHVLRKRDTSKSQLVLFVCLRSSRLARHFCTEGLSPLFPSLSRRANTQCPFAAISIINLPKNLESQTTHRYGPNSFKLHRLPMPRPGQVRARVAGKKASVECRASCVTSAAVRGGIPSLLRTPSDNRACPLLFGPCILGGRNARAAISLAATAPNYRPSRRAEKFWCMFCSLCATHVRGAWWNFFRSGLAHPATPAGEGSECVTNKQLPWPSLVDSSSPPLELSVLPPRVRFPRPATLPARQAKNPRTANAKK